MEHMRGLCVALYLLYQKTFLGSYRFGEIFVIAADAEVIIGENDAI